ncbi:AsmA family protein [Roseovarius salinarum]|uniref:AsmA family protein n=1 Tax=Roseovarius salinarum TaxID=1981892 RepID=UPI000C33FCF0|nr:AsmA family protein [Roseovarius salinarum]
MKWLFRILGLLVVFAVVAAGSLLLLPGDRIAWIAAGQIEGMTGRAVEMSGDTTVSFYPVLGISTGPVTIANAEWSDGGPMLRAESLKVGVDPAALIGGEVRITGLEARAPEILLERAADGRVNWELGVEGVAPSGETSEAVAEGANPLALTLDRALITGAAVTYADRGAGTRTEMRGMDFDLRWPEYAGEATLEATLRPAGQAVRISGALDRVGDFIAGKVTDLTLDVEAPGAQVSYAGQVGAQPQLGGRVQADIGDTAAFLSALGVDGAAPPQGLGRAITLDGQLSVAPDMRVSLRQMTLGLDNNRLTGDADLRFDGERPTIKAQLAAGALDLSALAAGGDTGGQGDAGAARDGWSKAPIDASALGLADADVRLSADSLELGDFRFGATRTKMTLDRSRAVFQLNRLDGYGGVVKGQFVANNRSGLSVGGDMNAEGIKLKPLLRDAAGVTRLSGRGKASLDFLGVGQSVHAIMNSLDGSVAIDTGRGKIEGINLDKLMRSGDVSGGTTIFESIKATFQIKDGLMTGDDLEMKLPLSRAEGKGGIDLGKRRINYLFTPVLLEGEKSRLAVPVRIKGPWASPSILPDLGNAIERNLDEEKKKLEKKAREKVEKELGIERKEGQSTEDAVKDKIGKELEKELKRLFE